MGYTRELPKVVHIADPSTQHNRQSGDGVLGGVTGVADIVPGTIVERYLDTGVLKYQPLSSAVNTYSVEVAMEDTLNNKNYTENWGLDELLHTRTYHSAGEFWAVVETGQTVEPGTLLKANVGGKLVNLGAGDELASANLAKFQAKDSLGTTTADTRCVVRVL